jgi:hypothetical protein
MRKLSVEIKWALLFVAFTLVWMLGEKLAGLYSTHIDKHAIVTNFFAVPAIAIYVLALLDKRRNSYGGTMTWKQGFVCGLIITLFVTMVSPLTQVIIAKVIAPEYFPNVISYAVSSGEMEQAAAEEYFNLRSYIQQVLIGTPVMGIVTSAIVAIFTRKAPNEIREGKVDVVFAEGPKTPQS